MVIYRAALRPAIDEAIIVWRPSTVARARGGGASVKTPIPAFTDVFDIHTCTFRPAGVAICGTIAATYRSVIISAHFRLHSASSRNSGDAQEAIASGDHAELVIPARVSVGVVTTDTVAFAFAGRSRFGARHPGITAAFWIIF